MADPQTREELEAQIEPVATDALQAWLTIALADVTGRTVDPTMVLRHAADWVERVHDSILPIVRAAWLARFTAIADRPPARSLITAYLEAAANRMVRVPDEVAARIQRIVARNIGTSIPDIAALIDAELSFSGTANWPNRATVIARTESAGAWNGSAVAAYRADQARLGITLFKKWLATDDERTRPTHVGADGQTIGLDGDFTVGGFRIDFPGDPRGPAHEVINCRCAVRVGTPGELAFSRARVFPVLPVVRQAFASADEDMSETVCIMALPDQADPVHEIGPEEKHATLLYFGKISEHGDPEWMGSARNLLAEVLSVAAAGQPPFDARVAEIDELGDEGARVWHLDSPDLRRLFDAIPDIDSEVASLYEDAAATRYPTYRPHVTIGYPSSDTGESDEGGMSDDVLTEAEQVDSIRFDRLALWWGDERYEFDLTGDGSQAATSLDVGTFQLGTTHEGKEPTVTETVMEHLTDDDRSMLTEGPAAAAAVGGRMRWAGILAPYNAESGDGRVITGNIDTRPLPLFLRWQPTDRERHDGAVAVGRILAAGSRDDVIAAGFTDVADEGPGIYGGGDLFDAAQYSGDSASAILAATNQMADGLGLVSVDLVECDGRFEGERLIITSGTLAGATLVNIPAFATARIPAPVLAAAIEAGTPTRLAEVALAFSMGAQMIDRSGRLFAVVGSTSLPIGPDRSWDGPRAAGRMLDAATTAGGTINVRAASRGFFWHDDDGAKRGDWKLPFADLVDGKLSVIPSGLSAVLSRLDSTDIPSDAKATIRRKVEAMQARAERSQDAAQREADEASIAAGERDDTVSALDARLRDAELAPLDARLAAAMPTVTDDDSPGEMDD